VQGEDPGFPAEADDLQDLSQTEIVQVPDKAHGEMPRCMRDKVRKTAE